MDNLSISAASGMRARMESLDLLANNVANASTGGYKADREFYSLFVGEEASGDPVTGELPALPVIESQWVDHSQGNLKNTANPLDLAIDGEGYFPVQTPNGVRYTRNGSLRVSPTGTLATSDGRNVLGTNGAPITLEPNLEIEVARDGTVTQASQVAGQIGLTAFDANAVRKAGFNYYTPAAGTTPRPATGAILQGKLEESNVGAAESAVRLVAIMRQFEMLQKAMSIGNELNRRAIEEVAKVAA
ncbi:MAG TPA: flagellar hook-basal body protein [Bryobacteraceae bacterium]|nr:flagellar hook-basal body protein [Bryobacteraceae bacterium]